MAVDTALYPAALNTTIPTASDLVSEGDDNFRQVKVCLKTTFANVNGALTATHTQFNYVTGVTSAIQTQLDGKAASDSAVITTAATLPAATTIGTVTAAEILRLAGVTSPIQTQLDAKANWAGQTYSGAHNFTAGSISVPTLTPGSSGNGAASVDYANALSFASALPGQSASTVGMFPRSDGASAAWAFPILFQNFISTSSAALKGFNNVITAGGITVTLPTLAQHEVCQITNSSNTLTPIVDFGTTKFRGQASPGLMTLNKLSATLNLTGTGNATYGLI